MGDQIIALPLESQDKAGQ